MGKGTYFWDTKLRGVDATESIEQNIYSLTDEGNSAIGLA
jgi:hypothetical protein